MFQIMTQAQFNECIGTTSTQIIRHTNRYRNFRCSIPMHQFQEHNTSLMRILNDMAIIRYYRGQEELSENEFHHMELFFNTSNSYTASAIGKKLNIFSVYGVEQADIRREIAYCFKKDTAVADGVVIQGGTHNEAPANNKEIAENMLNNFENVEDSMKYLKERDPMMWILKGDAIQRALVKHFHVPERSDFFLFKYKQIDLTSDENRLFAHVFVGPTKMGKTQYALSHFRNPLVIGNKQDFSRLTATTDGLIYDDLDMSKWSATRVIQSMDLRCAHTVDVKYSAIRVPAMLPRIICTNSLSLLYPTEALPESIEAIKTRIKIYYINDKLFEDGEPVIKKHKENIGTLQRIHPTLA